MERRESYEGLFILDAELPEDQLTKAQAQIAEQVVKLGGTVERQQPWGRRRLAYRLGKRRDGYYLLVYFTLAASAVKPLEQWCALNESILRRLVVIAAPPPVETVSAGSPVAAAAHDARGRATDRSS